MEGSAKTQSDKFKDLAREVEADEDEAVFDTKLRRIFRSQRSPVEEAKPELNDGCKARQRQ